MKIKSNSMDNSSCSTSLMTLPLIQYDNKECFRHARELSGREHELRCIQDALQRTSVGKSEMFLLKGASGTGKSSLVEKMRSVVMSSAEGIFVSGKFDLLQTSREPYSAIVAAFSDICDIIQSKPCNDPRKKLIQTMGSEGMILSRVISNFLITVEAEFEKDSSFLVTQNDVFRFKIACTLFLSLIATKDNPTLIFIDDLQWADEMSIDLIKSFIKNSDSRGILFCMAFREDEFDAQKMLFSEGNVVEYLHCTEISLENLDDIQVIAMVSSILGLPAESVSPLVYVIYEQTRGNPHSTVELLIYLQSSKALFYSEKTCSWEWSLLEIEKVLSNNPGEVVAKKMKGLDMVSFEILSTASFIGYSFDTSFLYRVLMEKNDSLYDEEMVHECVNAATTMGFLKNLGISKYCFNHDSYQHYLYHLLQPESKRETMHLMVGRSMMKVINDKSIVLDENSIFLAANNMVLAAKQLVEVNERLEIIDLLLSAAKLAALKMAIDHVSEYLECAVYLLLESDWSTHGTLCMEVYQMYAEITIYSRKENQSDGTIDLVLYRSSTLQDTIRANCTKIRSFGVKSDMKAMLDWACTLLRTLGEPVPKLLNLRHIVAELLFTGAALIRKNPEDFLSMDTMTNERKLAAMKVYAIVNAFCLAHNDNHTFLYFSLRRVRISAKYGICPTTAASLAEYAFVLLTLGRKNEAYKWGQVAIQMAKSKVTSLGARALSLIYTSMFIFPWRDQLTGVCDPLLESYRWALASKADLGFAFYGISGYIDAKLHLGAPLSDMESNLRRYCFEMKESHAQQMWQVHVIHLQYILNLRGESDDPARMIGEVMDQSFEGKCYQNDGDINVHGAFIVDWFKLLLLFERWDLIQETLPEAEKALKIMHLHFDQAFFTSLIVIASLLIHEKTNLRRFKQMARQNMKIIRKWHGDGVPIIDPIWKLLDALWKAMFHSNNWEVKFDDAIESLKQSSFILFEILAYQIAIRSELKHHNFTKGCFYWEKLVKRCQEWGSIALIEYLDMSYSHLFFCSRPVNTLEIILPNDI